jgi:uncharacterized protein
MAPLFRLLAPLALLAAARSATPADSLQPLTVRQVKVGGEIGRRIDITIANNLLALDADKDFLAPFQTRNQHSGYIGLGKLLLTAVRFAAYRPDARVAALKDRLVARTLAMQEADGYIGLMSAESRVEKLWDVHEAGYIVYGLLADYEFFHNRASLDGARKLADYLLANWSRIPADWGTRTEVAPHVAVTGIERTLLALHRATGDVRYRDFVLRERALAAWNLPIVIGRRQGIEGHIYAYLARSLAMLELYRDRPAPELLAPADRAVDFLTRGDGLAITGGAGQWEIWTGDQDGRGTLAETCATAYQLRVYDSLLRLRGDARYGDLMERTVYNALFAAQSPDGRKIRYFAPFEGPREYHPGDTYCCPGNYRRIVSELPEMIWYRWRNGVAVNLYTPSEARIGSLRLRQETDYPSSGTVTVRVDPAQPSRFPLRLRIPAWARGASLQVNGEAGPAAVPGTFVEIEREWKAGDTVRLQMPMAVRLVRGRLQQAGRVAVMRGPLVFCLNPAQQAALQKLDAADLSRHTIDPAGWQTVPSDAVRPGGIALRTGAWKPGPSLNPRPEMEIVLTEFADPEGRATYFKLRDLSVAVDDELFPGLSARSSSR